MQYLDSFEINFIWFVRKNLLTARFARPGPIWSYRRMVATSSFTVVNFDLLLFSFLHFFSTEKPSLTVSFYVFFSVHEMYPQFFGMYRD